jgi:hypothetical protein
MAFTKAYLSNRAAAYTPATIRGAWDQSAQAVTKALDYDPTLLAPTSQTTVAGAETNADAEWDVLLYRGVSGPLAAQTISGTVDLVLSAAASAAAADFYWHLHIYVTQGDSDTPRGTLLSDYRENSPNEWTTATTGRALAAAQALTDLAISAGDRLVVEIGYVARNNLTTSYTGYFHYGRPATVTADLSVGAVYTAGVPFVVFSNAINDLARPGIVSHIVAEAASYDAPPSGLVSHVFVDVASPLVVVVPAFVSQVVTEAASENTVEGLVSHLFVDVATRHLVDPCAAPPDGEDLGEADTVRIWDELDRGDGVVTRTAEEPLDDDDDYEGGHKPALLAGVSAITRALASLEGDYETGRFSVTRNDPELLERAAFAAPGDAWHRGTMAVKAASDEARAAHATPRLLALGVPDQDPGFDGLQVTYNCRDWVGAAKALGLNGDAQIPKRVFSAKDFPDAPRELLDGNHGVPIVLGIRRPPTPVPAPSLAVSAGGSLIAGKQYFVSVAPIVNGVEQWASPPASTTLQPAMLTRDATITPPHHGTSHSAHGTGDGLTRYYWTRATVIIGGNESPVSNVGDVHGDIDPGTGAFGEVSTAYAGVTHARVYLFNAYNANGLFDPHTNTANLRPHVPGDPVIVRYKEVAIGDLQASWWDPGLLGIYITDEDAVDMVDYLASGGNTVDATPAAVAGATAYRVYFADSPTEASFVRVKETAGPAVSFASHTDGDDAGVATLPAPAPAGVGRVRLIYAGTEVIGGVTRRRAVACGHAIKSVDKTIYNDGTNPAVEETSEPADMLWPGGAKWSLYFPVAYRDLIGTDGVTRRYTILYIDGARGDAFAAGTATLDIECHGMEDVGNASGEVIEDQHDQAVQLLNYFILGDEEGYTSGDWPMPPVIPGTSICQVNRPSFRALKALRQAQLAGGYSGGGVIGAGGTRITTTQILKQLQQSAAYQLGPNRFWQIAASALDPDDNPATYPVLDDEQNVHRGTLKPRPAIGELENEVLYEFAPTSSGEYGGSSKVRDAASITRHGLRRGNTRQMPFAQSPGVAAHAMGQILLQTAVLAWYVDFEDTFSALGGYDLGGGFGLIHYRGVGTTGPTARPFRIVRVVCLPSQRRYRLTGRDVAEILS